jgi:light-regulated signal transduction histidine kinase (bacteriophytochrome)
MDRQLEHFPCIRKAAEDRLSRPHFRDITELTRTRFALEESNKELVEFAYALCHDVQEPQRSATSFIQLFLSRYDHALDATGNV